MQSKPSPTSRRSTVTRRDVLKTAVATAIVSIGVADPRAAAATPYEDQIAAQAETDRRAFAAESLRIAERHGAQTRETVAALKRKYEKPVVGKVRVWDLVQQLALCIDPADRALGCASQLIHVQQIVEGMERDGITDPDFFIAAITHDLGKACLLAVEAPENVACANAAIGEYPTGVGLDEIVVQWNHDEFIYSRLKDHLPEHTAWLLRYHSLRIQESTAYMNERDRGYLEKYLRPFRKYDGYTKSIWHLPPPRMLDKYRDLIDKTFPSPIAF